jgi:hypothetical protein
MSLAEVLPNVQNLSRTEKVRLFQLLAAELAADKAPVLEAGQTYEVWSPHDAYKAAEVLLKMLEKETTPP